MSNEIKNELTYFNTDNNSIVNILESNDNIMKNYEIPKDRFIDIFIALNEETKIKVLKKISTEYTCYLLDSNIVTSNMIWINTNLIENYKDEIYFFKKINLMSKLFKGINNKLLKKLLNNLEFFYLEDIYNSIKLDSDKMCIFINCLNLSFMELLINKMEDNIIDFIGLNLSYLYRLELLSKIYVSDLNSLNLTKLSRLQIVLLLNTSYESIILNNLVEYETDFIKKVINKLNDNNFKKFFYSMKIDVYYQLIEYINYDRLALIINPTTNQLIIREILFRIKFEDINLLIQNLTMEQIISSTYELSDKKIIQIAKSLGINQRIYLENMFNRVSPNQINEDIPKISKQLICYLFMCSSVKPYIVNNLNLLNNNKITLLTNLMNGDDIFNLLKKINFNDKTFILSDLNKDIVLSLSDVVDRKLDNFKVSDNIKYESTIMSDLILIKLINIFLCLRLSPNNKSKLEKI